MLATLTIKEALYAPFAGNDGKQVEWYKCVVAYGDKSLAFTIDKDLVEKAQTVIGKPTVCELALTKGKGGYRIKVVGIGK